MHLTIEGLEGLFLAYAIINDRLIAIILLLGVWQYSETGNATWRNITVIALQGNQRKSILALVDPRCKPTPRGKVPQTNTKGTCQVYVSDIHYLPPNSSIRFLPLNR